MISRTSKIAAILSLLCALSGAHKHKQHRPYKADVYQSKSGKTNQNNIEHDTGHESKQVNNIFNQTGSAQAKRTDNKNNNQNIDKRPSDKNITAIKSNDEKAVKNDSYSWVVVRMAADPNTLQSYNNDTDGKTVKSHTDAVQKFLKDTYPYINHEIVMNTLELLKFKRIPEGDYLLETDGSLTAITASKPFDLLNKIVVGIYSNKCILFKGDIIFDSSRRVTTDSPYNWIWLYEYHFKKH